MDVDALIARQDGIVSRSQALECGVPARTVARRVSTAAWRGLYPGVYLVAGHRLTDVARVRATWLWGGDRSTLSGPGAAFWHGLTPGAPQRLQLTLPRATDRASRPGVRVRGRDLEPADRVWVRGVAVSAIPLTVLETAAVLERGGAFLDRALQRHVGFTDVYEAYCRYMGARGSRAAGRLLVAAADRADSAAERLLLRVLRDAGVPGHVRAFPFGPWEVDVAFPAVRLAVEVDGWAWHVDAERFRNDRRKGNALVAAGWTLLRFTWDDLDRRPELVVRRIREILTRAA